MKLHKTRSASRGVYTYIFADGTSVILHPGENGVSEMDIKRLHSLDDSEVYNNLKNANTPSNGGSDRNISLEQAMTDAPDKNPILGQVCQKNDPFEREAPEIEQLHEIVAQLTPKQQETYQKVIIEGVPMLQVAKDEGVSETAIRHRIEKIKAQIKKKMFF